ncbi:hypothetical protein [Legionella taurinensis]|nr:hypothetical protein [Legionella taurinensis]STY25365.1 ankyrin repeat protein [Legionella taurinensis]
MHNPSASNPLIYTAIMNLDVEQCNDLLNENKVSDINEFSELITGILTDSKINEHRRSFGKAVQILGGLIDQGLSLDIYTLPEGIFHRLFMEYPDTAYKIIDNFQKKIDTVSFPVYSDFLQKNLRAMLYSYSVLGFPDKNGPAFKKCLDLIFNFLKENQIDYTQAPEFEFLQGYQSSFWHLMETIVKSDSLISFQSLREFPVLARSIEVWEGLAIQEDNPEIFRKIWLENMKNRTQEQIFSKITALYHDQAYKCLAVVMENLEINDEVIKHIHNLRTISSKDQFNAMRTGDFTRFKIRHNGEILLALFKNNYRLAAIELFNLSEIKSDDTKKVKEAMEYPFLNLFSSTSFDKIRELVNSIPKDHPHRQTIIEVYEEVKTKYCGAAPCFSRYVKPNHTKKLKQFYGKNAGSINEDIQFGAKRMELVHELNRLLSNSTRATPSKPPFDTLPPGSKSQFAAFVLEKVSDQLLQTGRSKAVGELRESNDYGTPVLSQYAFALPLITTVFHSSDHVRIRKQDFSVSYGLFYNDLQVNNVEETKSIWSGDAEDVIAKPNLQWRHGMASLNATWPTIENLFAEIWSMDLSAAGKYSDYQDKLTVFYEKLAELSWLIGNTQPLQRGTGSFAETVVALMHVHHGLNPPVLKNDFPQLDVLNITFPLETYKKIFPYFFDSSTIPKHLRSFTNLPDLEKRSIAQQMHCLFTQFQRQPDNSRYELDEMAINSILKDHATNNKPPVLTFLNPQKDLLAKTSNYYFSLFNKADSPEQKTLLVLTILQFSKNKNLQFDIAKQICRDNFISCTDTMDKEKVINNALNVIKSNGLVNPENTDEKTIERWEQAAKEIAKTEKGEPDRIVLPKLETIAIKHDTDSKQESSTIPNKNKVTMSITKIPLNEREENILAVYTVLTNDELLRDANGTVPAIIKTIRDMVANIDPSKEENISNALIEIKRKIAENNDNHYNEHANDIVQAFAKPSCCDFRKIRAALTANPVMDELMKPVRKDGQIKL